MNFELDILCNCVSFHNGEAIETIEKNCKLHNYFNQVEESVTFWGNMLIHLFWIQTAAGCKKKKQLTSPEKKSLPASLKLTSEQIFILIITHDICFVETAI